MPDFNVEDTPEGNFAGFSVREADLVRHLEDKTKADEERRAKQPAEIAPPGATAPHVLPTPDSTTPGGAAPQAPQRRYEFGSAEDFQLRQALNHLQGKPVAVAKPREDVARNTTR